MEIAKQALNRLGKWEYFWVCLLVLVTVAMHFSIISQPNTPIFDEQYYVEDARQVLSGEGAIRPEHPPLGELFIVFGMFLFGDTPIGWRFFSMVFGSISIVLLYLICRRLALSKKIAFLATFLLALENLSFIQASVAMLDVYSLTFMLAAFWFYLRGDYPFAGVSICLSTLAKLTGALALPVIALHWLLARRDRSVHFWASMVLAPLLFLQLLPLFDFFITGHLIDPISRIRNFFTLNASVTFSYATHPYASRPWEWLLRPQIMPYWYTPHYTAIISFTIWALVIPSMLYLLFRAKKGNSPALFAILWFASTYLVWIPLELLTDRLTYVYYFYPTVGAICIGVSLGLSQLSKIGQTRRGSRLRWLAISIIAAYLVAHVAIFATLSPLTSWWAFPIPQ